MASMMEIRRQILGFKPQTPVTGLLYSWDFTKSLVDSVQNLEAVDNSQGTVLTRDSEGLHFTVGRQELVLPWVYGANRAYEVDVASFVYGGGSNAHIRFICFGVANGTDDITKINSNTGLIYRKNSNNSQWAGWWSSWDMFLSSWPDYKDRNAISGKTVRVELDSDYKMSVYIDGVFYGKSSIAFHRNETTGRCVRIGNANSDSGNTFYTALITGARVYDIS